MGRGSTVMMITTGSFGKLPLGGNTYFGMCMWPKLSIEAPGQKDNDLRRIVGPLPRW